MQSSRSRFGIGLWVVGILFFALALHADERLFDIESDAMTRLRHSAASKPSVKPVPKQTRSSTFRGQATGSLPPLRLESEYEEIDQESFYKPVSSTAWTNRPWTWQLFPDGMLYQNYLAGVNESRLGGVWNYDEDLGWMWDITLGGRAPILRYGTKNAILPEGFQFDIEGSVHLRLDLENEMEMDSNDFRFGLPLSYGNKIWQVKGGYYHVSSHMGDERMLRLEAAGKPHRRINYVREALAFGVSYRPFPALRFYAEADYAFDRGEFTKAWHFQFGAEYSSPFPSQGFRGAPFAAVNLLLLQEHNYDGSINVQAGWQWRGPRNQLLRVGLQYFGGVSEQYEHIHVYREHKIGIGLWYDF